MLNTWIIARRELGAIFVQPIAYVFTIVMLFITGFIFAAQISFPVIQGGPPPTVASILSTFTFLSIFTLPAVTMRLLSEEQQSGTIELLMTFPVRDMEVVIGKWLAGFIFYLFVLLFTLIYPFLLIRFGNPDMGPIISGYFGAILWGAALVGIGVLASAMSENQINALIIAAGINLVLYLMAIPADFFTVVPTLSTLFNEMSMQSQLSGFLSGLITVADILYYVIVAAIALFAAARVLESRRWR
jgi:ABC-2 type transport system permease protein